VKELLYSALRTAVSYWLSDCCRCRVAFPNVTQALLACPRCCKGCPPRPAPTLLRDGSRPCHQSVEHFDGISLIHSENDSQASPAATRQIAARRSGMVEVSRLVPRHACIRRGPLNYIELVWHKLPVLIQLEEVPVPEALSCVVQSMLRLLFRIWGPLLEPPQALRPRFIPAPSIAARGCYFYIGTPQSRKSIVLNYS